MEKVGKDTGVPVQRLVVLIDGIFSIAMTLLVFNIKLPSKSEITSGAALSGVLLDLIPSFIAFGQSFILLALFWFANHRQFRSIRHADNRFMWLNVFWLMVIVLVPFSTSLVAQYGSYWIGAVFFHSNLLLIGILSYSIWRYAGRKGLVHESLDEKESRFMNQRSIVFPLAAILALATSPLSPSWSNLCYLLIPIGLWIFGRKRAGRR